MHIETHPSGLPYSHLILTAGMALALLSVLMALPPFAYGVWYQSEPVSHALHLSAALVAAGLCLGVLHGTLDAGMFYHPLVRLPLAIALASALLSPFAILPMMSWSGTPQLGEGVLQYLELALWTAAALVIQEHRHIRILLCALAVTVAVTLAALTVTHSSWAPYAFPDHLAFYGMFLGPILVGGLELKTLRTRVAAHVPGGVIICLSSNDAAIVLALTAAPLAYAFTQYKRWPNLGVALAAAVPLLVSIGIDITGRAEPGSSLWSRVLLQENLPDAFMLHPAALITGLGWGAYSEHGIGTLLSHAMHPYANGTWQPDWDGLYFSHFHSHNAFLEALLSTGVVGLVVFWAWLIAVPRHAKPALQPEANMLVVLLAGTLAAWFQLPGSWPFMALALGYLGKQPLSRPQAPCIWAGVCAAISLVISAATAMEYTLTTQTVRLMDRQRTVGLSGDCRHLLPFDGANTVYLTQAAFDFLAELKLHDPTTPPLSQANLQTLETIACAQDHAADNTDSLRPRALGLILRAELAFPDSRHPELAALAPHRLADWPARLNDWIARAPARSDMVAPYLFYEFEQGHDDAVLALSEYLLKQRPHDPVGLWFSGAVLLGDAQSATEGVSRLKQSLDEGVERLIPVDSALVAHVRDAH